MRSFIVQELGTQHAYTFAVHDKPAANDPTQRQVHAHIMFSPKIQDGIERSREHFFKRYNSRHPELGGAKNDVRFSSMQGSSCSTVPMRSAASRSACRRSLCALSARRH